MNKEILRERLLSTDCFYDNDMFDKYIDLLIDKGLDQPIRYISHTHHILPVVYFKINNKEIDNSEDNLIELEYKYHILAHAYLSYASKEKRMKAANIQAFHFMTHGLNINKIKDPNFIYVLEDLQNEYGNLSIIGLNKGIKKSEEHKKKLSDLRWCHKDGKEKHYTVSKGIPEGWEPGRDPVLAEKTHKKLSGFIWMNNGISNYEVRKDSIDEYLLKGFSFGMLDRGTEWKNKVGRYERTKESIEKCLKSRSKTLKEHPERNSATRFKKGQNAHNKGKMSITNGVRNKYIYKDEEIPDGWYIGNTQHKNKLK